VRAFVPDGDHAERRQLERQVEDAEALAVAARQPLGQHGDHVRAPQDLRHQQEVRDREPHVARPADRRERVVRGRAESAPRRGHQHVIERAVLVEREPLPHARMALAHHADEPLDEQRTRPDARRRESGAQDPEIDLAGLEAAPDRAEVHRAHREPRPRRPRLEEVHQPGQDRELDVVRCGDREGALGAGGIERARLLDEPDDLAEHLSHRRDQRLPLGGGQHPAGGAQEQRIAKERAQPAERRAHRRLREVQPARRARDVALAQERVQRDQQVEVDRADIH
jgi:hypothetical protein